MSTLFTALLTGPALNDRVSPSALVAAMVRFEVALAQAQAALGMIPSNAADAIEAAQSDFAPDVDAIVSAGHTVGTPVIALLEQFGGRVESCRKGAREWLHYGATSQDVLDTATVIAVAPLVREAVACLERSRSAAVTLARTYERAPVLARTLLQPAGLTTFGLKAALWAHSLERCRRRLAAAADLGLTIQLAGAIGTGQQFGTKWSALQDEIGRALGLRAPDGGSWQSGRDEWVDLLMQMAMATGVATKIAGDIALMNQAEVAEVSEPPVAGSTSSVLPHKQNPVLAMRIRASGLVVSGHAAAALQSLGAVEHERGLGAWQAELALAPALVAHALSALQALVSLLEGLRFHADRAHANVERLGGLIFADRALSEIAALVPGAEARAIVERACRETRESGEHLRAVLARDLADGGANRPTRDEVDAALERAFDPAPAIDTAVRAAGRALPEAT